MPESRHKNILELIESLCPDGVEFKTLNEVATISRGVRVVRKQLETTGNIPVYQNSIKPLGYYHKSNCKSNTTFIIGAGTAGEIGFSLVDFWAADDCYYFICSEKILDKFLYYALYKEYNFIKLQVRKASIPRIARSAIEKISIPLPPLEIQAEIVKILDELNSDIIELQQNLERELELRKKQYNYYKNQLFSFGKSVPEKKIPEFALTYIGLVTTMTKHYVDDGVPLIHNSDIKENRFEFAKPVYLDLDFAENNSGRKHELDDIITVHTGDVGTSAIIDKSLVGSLGFATIVSRIIDREEVNPKYLCYFLNSDECRKQIYSMIKGDRNNLNLKDFNKILVPIPPIEEQKHIVSILDRFESLCKDLTEGLPAEIAARQKQYEYYRDMLLNFRKK